MRYLDILAAAPWDPGSAKAGPTGPTPEAYWPMRHRYLTLPIANKDELERREPP